jgi:hypothetical protein
LGYESKEIEFSTLKNHLYSHVHQSIIRTVKIWKESECSSLDEGPKKMWLVPLLHYSITPLLRRLRQEDHEFKATLDYITRPSQNKSKS